MTSTSDQARGILGGEMGDEGIRNSSGASAPEQRRSAPASVPADPEPQASGSLEDTFNFEQAREQALIEAYSGGDAGALEELLTTHEGRIYATCLRMTGDPDLARDLTQDTFLRVIQGLGQFSGKSRLSTWMTRIAINVCLSDRRRRAVRQAASLDQRSGQGAGGPGEGGEEGSLASILADDREPDVLERVEERDDRRRLALAMSRLDPQRRAILILRDGQDLDYGEIADILGVPTGTVKSRLFRARVALRTEIEKFERSEKDSTPTESAGIERSAEGSAGEGS